MNLKGIRIALLCKQAEHYDLVQRGEASDPVADPQTQSFSGF